MDSTALSAAADSEAPARPAAASAMTCGMAVRPMVLGYVVVASCLSALLGYDIGIMSGAKIKIQEDPAVTVTDHQVELMVGILNLASAPGALASGHFADVIGRKKTMALACVVCIAGSALMATASGFGGIFFGRIVAGIGVGFGMQIAPLYIAEVSPKSLRGALVGFFELSINTGLLLGYISSWLLSDLPPSDAWRSMLGIGIVPPAVILLGLLRMPESPRWLVQSGREAEARQVLATVYEAAEADEAIATLAEEVETSHLSFAEVVKTLRNATPAVKNMLLIGVGNSFFQQASGQEAAVYYTPEVLRIAGVAEDHLFTATIGIGLVKVLFIIVAMGLLDKTGRRPLLILSAGGLALCQFLIGTSFALGGVPWLSILAQCCFMAFFSIGYGPVFTVLASEIFSLRIRGVGMGLSMCANRFASGTVSGTFLSLNEMLTPAGTFYFFTVIALIGLWFSVKFVPETKGKSLEEIEIELTRGAEQPSGGAAAQPGQPEGGAKEGVP